jgi:23S rRNA pseudouridine1911/1915/1917 synthase
MATNRFEITVDADEGGQPLADVLAARLHRKPDDVRRLTKSGALRLNGKVVRDPSRAVGEGDEVTGEWPPARRTERFHILYEDEHVLAVHKGPGLLSVPDRTPTPALTQQLETFLTAREGGRVTIHPVHRLDKNVSGILLFAKAAAVRDELRRQFAEGLVKRTYLAGIRGKMRPSEGTIRSYLDTRGERPRSVAPHLGVEAVTHYRTHASGEKHSLVEAELETGRKNQIRVHLAESGHPILGDRVYKGMEEAGFDRRRIALHAFRLVFRHPSTGDMVTVEDPVPEGFARLAGGRR